MKDFVTFLRRVVGAGFKGGWRYQAWLGLLVVLCLVGLNAYSRQLVRGLAMTGMTDEVSWGLYVANFTFLVGIAAAAVLVVIPVYVYKNKSLRDLVLFGEWMAVSALVMSIAFVIVDMGRPDRLWHMIPGIGKMSFPSSILVWDVIVLSGYLVLNLYLATYLLYSKYRNQKPVWVRYKPFVMISIVWAISIHTVTAFLFMGLGGRPFWNTALLGPRFIASAFTAGPALIILALIVIRAVTEYRIPNRGLLLLRRIIQVAILINIFFLLNELFKEFYTANLHVASATYLYFGLHGHEGLVPWIWTALVFNFTAMAVFLLPVSKDVRWLSFACILSVVGIWIEKGMGFVVPGFLPTPLGEIVEYTPSFNEVLVTVGIWGLGLLVFTILVRISLPVLQGKEQEAPAVVTSHAVAVGV